MKRNRLLSVSLLAGAAFISTAVQAADLTVAILGGTVFENTKKCLGDTFEKQNNAVVDFVVGGSSQNSAKIKAKAGSPDVDVAYMSPYFVLPLKSEGLLETLDPAKIKNMADVIPAVRDPDNKFIGAWVAALVLAYNPKMVESTPTSWKDLWNPAYKGKIVLPDITTGGEMLIAAARMFGGSIDDVTPAIAPLKELNAGVLTYITQPDQVISLFDRGDIVIAPWWSDRANAAIAKGLPIEIAYPKEGGVGNTASLVIPKGAQHVELAEKYIDTILSPDMQACFAAAQSAGPTNSKVELPPDLAARLPYGATLANLYFPDPAAMSKHLAEWSKMWTTEISQ